MANLASGGAAFFSGAMLSIFASAAALGLEKPPHAHQPARQHKQAPARQHPERKAQAQLKAAHQPPEEVPIDISVPMGDSNRSLSLHFTLPANLTLINETNGTFDVMATLSAASKEEPAVKLQQGKEERLQQQNGAAADTATSTRTSEEALWYARYFPE